MKGLAIVKCGEKGFVLILALVAMVAMTLIGLSLIMNITTDVQLARNEKESMLAFQLAEAGVREASARLHLPSANANYIGEIAGETNYRNTLWTKSFLSDPAVAGTLPASQSYTVTLTYLDESNPEGYCDSNNTGDAIGLNSGLTTDSFFSLTSSTVQADCTTARGGNYNVAASTCSWAYSRNPNEIVMYGQDFNLSTAVTPIQYGTLPVYKVSSVGTVNNTTRTVEAYLGESNLNTDTRYGINTNGCITTSGDGTSSAITIDGGGAGQIVQKAGCACPVMGTGDCATAKTTATDLTIYLGDTIPNIKTYADQVITCSNAACTGGNPAGWNGNIATAATSLGNVGANEGVLLVVDNAGGVTANMNSAFADGEGILIVTGNLTISGNFRWEGMIYVMGNLTITGTPTIKGGIMAGSTAGNTVALNDNVTLSYSKEELAEMARQTSSSATITWKRF
jgi:Tfp pilus assembly protein PilX